jgi:hypothetical protein
MSRRDAIADEYPSEHAQLKIQRLSLVIPQCFA